MIIPLPNLKQTSLTFVINDSVIGFSQESGFYDSGFSLELTANEGEKIYYTTDGTDPRTSATREEYTAPIEINHYGVNKDDVVVYKGDAETYQSGYKLDEGKLPEGETDEGYFFKGAYRFLRFSQRLIRTDGLR